ncbi:MAG TPA: sigma-70 family RNA polymerase sigma factor [Mucilaginibacter sp.]|nr:sigma-70 family RNA polymerase sigma factor [Mucilaginibacter sp.]
MAIIPIHNEPELLDKIAKDDDKAFAALFYAYHNQVGAFILPLVDSVELTEEIVQDIFVKIWLNRKTLPSIRCFTSYLFILSRNYTLNCIRKMVKDRQSQQQYDKMQSADSQYLVGEEVDIETEANVRVVIDRAVAQLPPQQQRVFMLRQSGLKNPEIAREMNISPQSVKKYQQWAMKAVSEFVKTNAALFSILIISRLISR